MIPAHIKARFIPVLLGLVLLALDSRAHLCGPSTIEVEVGKAALWRVYADRSETLSFYEPDLVGSAAIAEVYPRNNFYAHHGDFLITGRSPGTNFLNVEWSYEPTAAGGFCQVMIVVKPDDGIPDLHTITNSGVLVAADGPHITSSDLFFQIDRYIPRESPKLLVFAQCFGGNMALHSLFQNMPNTTVLSATSPNQEAHYGGYHDDAARALKPEAGRTAQTVHEEGSIGKSTIIPKAPDDASPDPVDPNRDVATFHKYAELPRVTGTLPPGQFSLEPVNPTGAVHSRHIVVFAGKPGRNSEFIVRSGSFTIPASAGVKEYFTDAADRDQIRTNFLGEPNTTFVAVGGKGDNGWDRPGNLANLAAAIQEAGEAIENSPDPSREQFILFVTDHGEEGSALFPTPRLIPGTQQGDLTQNASTTRTTVGTNLQPFHPNDPVISSMLRAVDNQPGVVLRFEVTPAVLALVSGSVSLDFYRGEDKILSMDQFSSAPVDLDGDGVVGSIPEESIHLFYPMAETDFMALLTEPFSLDILNNTGSSLQITEALLVTGGISPGNSRPGVLIDGLRLTSGGDLEIDVTGAPGERHVVEISLDLSFWEPVVERVFSDADETISFSVPPGSEHWFIRIARP